MPPMFISIHSTAEDIFVFNIHADELGQPAVRLPAMKLANQYPRW